MSFAQSDTRIEIGAPSLDLFRQATAADLATLALLHNAELDDELVARLRGTGYPEGMGLRLVSRDGIQAHGLMKQVIEAMDSPMGESQKDDLAADYAAIYLTFALHASPCESVWLDQENLGMQAPMFQVREFYRYFNLGASNWRMRPDDHLVLELHFLSCLMQDEHSKALQEAARFLDEHLLRWLPLFAHRVAARCATPFYAAVALLTLAYCDELRDVLAGLVNLPRPTPEEVEARMKPRPQSQVAPISYMPGAAPSW